MKKIRAYTTLFLLILFIASCATNRPKITRNDCKLFPYGTYKQNIIVKVDKSTFKFKGVMQKSNIANTIYGLSAFDTTIFKIKDDRSGQLEINIYSDKLAGKEDKIKDIYKTLSKVIDFEQCINEERTLVINKTIENNDIKIEFNEFDGNKIPTITKLFDKNYEVTIRTYDYEI